MTPKKARSLGNLTQAAIAARLNVGRAAVSKWEAGATNPPIKAIHFYGRRGVTWRDWVKLRKANSKKHANEVPAGIAR